MDGTAISLPPLGDELFLCATEGESYMTLDDVIARLDAAGWWGGVKFSPKEKRAEARAKLKGMTNERGFPMFSAWGRPRRYVQYTR